MKKRILAVFLAFCVFMGAFSVSRRAHAAGAAAVSAVVAVGLVAWELLDLMIKGEEPGIVVAMRTFIESGIDGLTNPDSAFQQNFRDFWDDYGGCYEIIYNEVLEMYESGEIAIKNGKIDLTYEQFLELYGIAYSYVDNLGVEFTTPYNYFAFDYSLTSFLPVLLLPTNDMYFKSDSGQSYCLIFYDDNKVVFSDTFLNFRSYSDRYYVYLHSVFRNLASGQINGFGLGNISLKDMDYLNVKFSYFSLSELLTEYRNYGSTSYNSSSFPLSHCIVFKNGVCTYQPISSVDVSNCKTGIISTTGNLGEFLQSLEAVKFVDSVSGTLDDLSSVLPVDESPVLSFPANPDLSVPIPDQVTVTTPTAADVPIADYLNPVITDIETPSIILEKFPFCIPYDFIRIIGVLAADPVAPVFHIPISTHPNNLEQFAGNETIGEYVSPEDPMFEIDEEIVIDLSHIPLIQPICYTIFIVGFVILLIKLTPKLIQH